MLTVLFCLNNVQAKEWYEVKGTLHTTTVGQYLEGDPADMLATAGDWVGSTIGDKEIGNLNTDLYKEGSKAVLNCIKATAKENKPVKSQKAAEISVMCMALLKKSYPWMMTKF